MDRLDRRSALTIVAALLTQGQSQQRTTTCSRPETLVLDLGSPAGCAVNAIRIQFGAVSATVTTSELLTALGAKIGG